MGNLLHRAVLVLWLPIMLVIGTFMYAICSPIFAADIIWQKLKEHW